MSNDTKEEVMSDRENKWMQLIYEEAWRQYVHEDEMAEQRDSKYLTILSLMFSGLGVIVSMLLSSIKELDFSLFRNCIYFLGIQGMILIILVVIMVITLHWKRVTEAGQEFTGIRFDVAKEIEEKYDFETALARTEDERIRKAKQGKKTYFEGFEATKSLIHLFGLLSAVLFVADFIAMLVMIIMMF